MQPIAPLMREHRLIERLVKLLRNDLERIRANILVNPKFAFVDPVFLDVAVDFLRTYADQCHHGKEEDILFAELSRKELAPELKKTMEELTAEHRVARQYTRELLEAKERYLHEEPEALQQMLSCLDRLTVMYPRHIVTEEQHFFVSAMSYFSLKEKEGMLARMREFDEKIIHRKYEDLIASLERHGTCRLTSGDKR